MSTQVVVVLTTVATEPEATALIRELLERRWEDRVADESALPISDGLEQYLGWIGRET